jgi:hypothetical protein
MKKSVKVQLVPSPGRRELLDVVLTSPRHKKGFVEKIQGNSPVSSEKQRRIRP